MSVLSFLIGSMMVLQANNMNTLNMFPTRVCYNTPMTLIKKNDLDLSLAVITHDGRFTYIADHDVGTTIPLYWIFNEVFFGQTNFTVLILMMESLF